MGGLEQGEVENLEMERVSSTLPLPQPFHHFYFLQKSKISSLVILPSKPDI